MNTLLEALRQLDEKNQSEYPDVVDIAGRTLYVLSAYRGGFSPYDKAVWTAVRPRNLTFDPAYYPVNCSIIGSAGVKGGSQCIFLTEEDAQRFADKYFPRRKLKVGKSKDRIQGSSFVARIDNGSDIPSYAAEQFIRENKDKLALHLGGDFTTVLKDADLKKADIGSILDSAQDTFSNILKEISKEVEIPLTLNYKQNLDTHTTEVEINLGEEKNDFILRCKLACKIKLDLNSFEPYIIREKTDYSQNKCSAILKRKYWEFRQNFLPESLLFLASSGYLDKLISDIQHKFSDISIKKSSFDFTRMKAYIAAYHDFYADLFWMRFNVLSKPVVNLELTTNKSNGYRNGYPQLKLESFWGQSKFVDTIKLPFPFTLGTEISKTQEIKDQLSNFLLNYKKVLESLNDINIEDLLNFIGTHLTKAVENNTKKQKVTLDI